MNQTSKIDIVKNLPLYILSWDFDSFYTFVENSKTWIVQNVLTKNQRPVK